MANVRSQKKQRDYKNTGTEVVPAVSKPEGHVVEPQNEIVRNYHDPRGLDFLSGGR